MYIQVFILLDICPVAVSNDLFRCIKFVALTAVALRKVTIFFLTDISEIKWLDCVAASAKKGKIIEQKQSRQHIVIIQLLFPQESAVRIIVKYVTSLKINA